MESLLFAFLDECLFSFSTEYIVCKDVRISFFDREKWVIEAKGLVARSARPRALADGVVQVRGEIRPRAPPTGD
jgi:hypothetical protein